MKYVVLTLALMSSLAAAIPAKAGQCVTQCYGYGNNRTCYTNCY